MDDIIVSINCITYNHEKYISKALDSFLMQKTNFKFEILIHDDASTDNTANIIREYQEKYPDIIKPILQKENQYSKGITRIDYKFNHTRANGKYIAICEGDDYWTDPYKLQKQVDYMESNPDCTFCFHNAFIVDDMKEKQSTLVIPWLAENRIYYSNSSRKYTLGEIELLGFIPTASFMFPKSTLDNPPEWYFDAPVGDNSNKLISTSKGYAYYMNEVMCVYRINVKDSITYKWKKESMSLNGNKKKIQRCNSFIQMLDDFDEWTQKEYTKEIDEAKKTWEVQREIEKSNHSILKDVRYKSYFERLTIKEKLKVYVKLRFPKITVLLRNIITNL